jgi:hypothetical protein
MGWNGERRVFASKYIFKQTEKNAQEYSSVLQIMYSSTKVSSRVISVFQSSYSTVQVTIVHISLLLCRSKPTEDRSENMRKYYSTPVLDKINQTTQICHCERWNNNAIQTMPGILLRPTITFSASSRTGWTNLA